MASDAGGHGVGRPRPATAIGHVRRAVWVLAVLLCVWCGWVSGFHRATTAARVTWGFSLAMVLVINVLLWQGRRGRTPGLAVKPACDRWPRPGRGGRLAWAGTSPWLGLTLLVAAWDVLGLDTPKHEPHLTISALTQAFRPLNAAMLLVWMSVGIGYGLARARTPRDLSKPDEPAAHGWVTPLHAPVIPGLLLPSNRALGVTFWLGVVALAIAIDAVARRSHGKIANSEELVRLITAPLAANIVLVGAWVYAGYHLFAH